jgi:hypothetical protein
MVNDGANSERRDQVWQGSVNWDLGLGGTHVGNTLWRCDALRAGRLYSRNLFGSRVEAEQFAQKMREAEPDQMFNVEAIKASTVWN